MSSNPITLQQVFDAAWQAFIVEGQPPCTVEGHCVYKFSRGNPNDLSGATIAKCAIGLVFTDDQFSDLAHHGLGSMPVSVIVSKFPHWFQPAETHWVDGLCSIPDETTRSVCKDGNIVQRVFRDAQCSLHDYCLDTRDSSKFKSLEVVRRQYVAFASRYGLTIPEKGDDKKDNVTASV